MTDIKSQYQQWQVETNAAFTKCKADIEEIANYLLESKYGSITKPVGFGVAVIVPPAGIE